MRNIVILNSLHFSYPLPILMRVSYNTLIVKQNTSDYYKYTENAAYLRVKNITLAYSFPKNWVQKAFMKDAKIYLSIENPFTFSSLPKGYDPEGNEYNEIVWNYPYYRTISLGANITF